MIDRLVQVQTGNFFYHKKKLFIAKFNLKKRQKIKFNCKIKALQLNTMDRNYKLLKVPHCLKIQNEIIY